MGNEKYGQNFQRHELKYILTHEQYLYVKSELLKYMKVDKYGISTIQSVYYDTPSHLLIRNSVDKPKFKEKIRLRSYGLAKPGSPCFLEIKRKAVGLVYKRRIMLSEEKAHEFFNYNDNAAGDGQIARELTAFRNKYESLIPSMLIIYERESFFRENSEVRVTFDFAPRYRTEDLNLHTSLEGTPLLDPTIALMEIKVLHNMPLWLTGILTRGNIKRGSFSKYGRAYAIEKEKHNGSVFF